MTLSTLGVDIGGANLKLADSHGFARSVPFPLWQRPHDLGATLARLVKDAPRCHQIAITMTGELADCFATKREGVEHILAATRAAIGDIPSGVYALPGAFLSEDAARRQPLAVAAANWHALATVAARQVQAARVLVIDVGSTTSDIVPVVDGKVTAIGANDPERLLAGELVYTGVRRSPVCAVTATLPWRGQPCATAQEFFANTLDAYLILGDLPEREDDLVTADGRPAMRSFARDRLARCICADRDLFSEADALAAAEAIQTAQLAKLGIAARGVIRRMPAPPEAVVLSGGGEFLAERVVKRLRMEIMVLRLSQALGNDISEVAAAWAVACLASEQELPRFAGM